MDSGISFSLSGIILFFCSIGLAFGVGLLIGDASGRQTRERTILRYYKLKKRKKPLLEAPQEDQDG